jgi:hypothetical protein
MKAALLAALFLLPPTAALAWEATAAGVEKRLLSRPSPAAARQKSKPRWARKIKAPEEKVSWTETYKGKTYLFGVGLVRNVDNPGLRVTAAQDRARASLLEGKESGELEGSRILDWYLTRAGDMYALAVLIR